ncbi:hypothetical protein GCM10019016_134080 [Streptomyces prasinosporus]|uniref:Uncharacterized protein n=1 Tax=Streptomyces prasinosporus TaxID=68256 RepID=A0ABP6UHT7_9ACTN
MPDFGGPGGRTASEGTVAGRARPACVAGVATRGRAGARRSLPAVPVSGTGMSVAKWPAGASETGPSESFRFR